MPLEKLSAFVVPATALLLAGIAAPHAGEARTAVARPGVIAPSVDTEPPSLVPDAARPATELDPDPASPATELAPEAARSWPSPDAPRPAGASITAQQPVLLGDAHFDPALGRYVAPLSKGGRAILTLDPRLQERLERTLSSYAVEMGATVLLEPTTGRVLALAEHSQAQPRRRDLALTPLAPAASVFKIVTAAALLERGVGPDDEVCYHGGKHRLQPRLLADDPRRDRRCLTLAAAFGHSANVVFAKLADRGLDANALRATAERFLFNVPIAFARPVEASPATIPDDPFELANTAAGFGAVRLSPLHAALLAAVVANGGVLVPPVLVEAADGAPAPAPLAPWRVVDESVALRLAEMMRNTVTEGTARRAFRRAPASLRDIPVAGKTGSLADHDPFRDYSWFVGYAPADRPQIVVATVVANGRLWRVRAPRVAREALEAYFATRVAGAGGDVLRTAAVR